MKHKSAFVGYIMMAIIFTLLLGNSSAVKEIKSQEGVPPEIVADYLHSIIEADRTLYTTHIVQRMQENDIVGAAETWKKEKALPLPAQMLALSGLRVKHQGNGIQYRLASLWPIYEKNRPTTEFERTGLEAVAADPRRPYTGIVMKKDRRIFTAIYADKAISQSCVTCHNGHALSPRRDYKLDEVMGGIIISFPLQ